jgi:hypothetical protein
MYKMRFLLSYILYTIGDIISKTTMMWGDGFGYRIYSKIMLASSDLDKKNKIWKNKKSKRKTKK